MMLIVASLLILFLLPSNYGDSCTRCREIANSFQEGLRNTDGKSFSDGTLDISRRLKYATSELRFTEIFEKLCQKNRREMECYDMLEILEPKLEKWWSTTFRFDQSNTDYIKNTVCTEARVCCDYGYFGPDCESCHSCSVNGICDGNGTRSGTGKCSCRFGYAGDDCGSCNVETHYALESEDSLVCLQCHMSCSGGCKGPEPTHCIRCAEGWFEKVDDNVMSCSDVNECENSPCESDQYCLNTQGSYQCPKCDRACKVCAGPTNANCTECATGYARSGDGICEDIDECQTSGICPSKEICINNPGGYRCACPDGYRRRNGECRLTGSDMPDETDNRQIVWNVQTWKAVSSLLIFFLFCWYFNNNTYMVLTLSVLFGAFVYYQKRTDNELWF